ncbi:MAG: MotA/TolQ/ExbB proton channel family protein [Acidobacteriota bacterium]|nr:MotA/TolQ/ExbB proton channel family protein [Acidobacteriota bacterium]
MDISTVIGLVIGTALVVIAIVIGDDPTIFIDSKSALIVVGGTLGVTFIKNSLNRVFGTIGVVKNAFFGKVTPIDSLIESIVELSRKARRESLLSLEKVEIEDPFLAKAVRLAVDGMEPAAIRTVLEAEVAFLQRRHKIGADILDGMASPPRTAFGMVGTLIGLVQMLASMEDPSTIGPSMAVAILTTTLCGALIANLFCQPLAAKLENRSREEVNTRLKVRRPGRALHRRGRSPRLRSNKKLAAPISIPRCARTGGKKAA